MIGVIVRYLSLDISTNTGWAVFEDDQLLEYDVFVKKVLGYKADIKSYQDLPFNYPDNIINTADLIASDSLSLVLKHDCEYVVIEHPEIGKQRISQRLLEWTQICVYKTLSSHAKVKYLLVADWRKQTKCYLKHWPDFQKWNKIVKAAKKIAKPTKTGRKLAKIDGKVVSKMDQKKLSIFIANQHYGLNIKNDNIADAINLGRAAYELEIFNA